MKTAIIANLLGWILWGGFSNASSITVTLTGTVTSVDDPGGVFGGAIQDDDGYSARFIFDSASPDLVVGDPTTGAYRARWVRVIVGGLTFEDSSNTGYVTAVNDLSGDHLAFGCDAAGPAEVGLLHLEGSLMDWTGAALASDALLSPSNSPSLAAFQDTFFRGSSGQNPVSKFAGTIESFEVLPEPGTVCFLLFGALLIWRRR